MTEYELERNGFYLERILESIKLVNDILSDGDFTGKYLSWGDLDDLFISTQHLENVGITIATTLGKDVDSLKRSLHYPSTPTATEPNLFDLVGGL